MPLHTREQIIAKRESQSRGLWFSFPRNKSEASRPASGTEDEGDDGGHDEGECVDGIQQQSNQRARPGYYKAVVVFVPVDRVLRVDKVRLYSIHRKKADMYT